MLAAAATPLYVDHLVNEAAAAVILAEALAKATLTGVVAIANAPVARLAALADKAIAPICTL